VETLFALIAVGLAIGLIVLWQRAENTRVRLQAEVTRLTGAHSEALRVNESLATQNDALLAENRALAAFRHIVDARAEAERILREAQTAAAAQQADAEQIRAKATLDAKDLMAWSQKESADALTRAQEEAKTLRVHSNLALKDARERIDSMMKSAAAEAGAIVEKANAKAVEIAGSAMEAVRNAEKFEQVAKAMKNLIEGYGDQYLIPSRSRTRPCARRSNRSGRVCCRCLRTTSAATWCGPSVRARIRTCASTSTTTRSRTRSCANP